MYKSIKDFQDDWAYESESTSKVIGALTDESLDQKVTDDGRSLGFIAWHTAVTIPELLGKTGLQVDGPAEDAPMPDSAAEIKAAYDKASASLVEALNNNWNDGMLEEVDDMYGEPWKKGQSLSNLIAHQCHHRGQMTVLMRQAGLRVPGFYGPAKEDWAAMGMEPLP